jgi:hypothetical protein
VHRRVRGVRRCAVAATWWAPETVTKDKAGSTEVVLRLHFTYDVSRRWTKSNW